MRAVVGSYHPEQIAKLWTAPIPLVQALAAKTAPASEAVHVVGNHGRWVVNCPDCRSAQLGTPDDRRFMCFECGNAVIGGLWRPVVWPKDHAALGALLDERGDHRMRNYEPGESVADLREQNRILDSVEVIDGISILPVVETDGARGALASEHEGHEHQWPKRVEPRETYACKGCDLALHGQVIIQSRAEARTPAERATDERVRLEKAGRR